MLSFVVVLCSTICASVYASGSTENKVVKAELFAPVEIQDVKDPDGVADPSLKKITLKEIKPPFLFFAAKEGVMVAVAEAKYTKNDEDEGNQKAGVVAKYLKAENKNKLDESDIIKMSSGNWNTQLATKEGDYKENVFLTTKASALSLDGNKIYIFLINITDQSTNQEWKFKLVEGTVNGEEKNGKLIKWSTKEITQVETIKELKKNYKRTVLIWF